MQSTDTLEAKKAQASIREWDGLYYSLEDLLESFQEDIDNAEPMAIHLTDVSESNWIKEGTENTQNPERLAAPSLYCIMPTCKVALAIKGSEKGYRLEEIRYIKGCSSLSVKYQNDSNITPSPDRDDNIWIAGGTETFLKVGADAQLYDYIKLYQGNANNPHRPPTAAIEFEEIIEKEVAEIDNTDFALKRKAVNIVGALQKEKAGGKGYEYDVEKVEMYATIFGIIHLNSTEEKFNYLSGLSLNEPKLIVDSVMNVKKDYVAAIKQAIDLSVIVLDNEKTYFSDNNTVILPFATVIDKTVKINRLVDFFLTPQGNISYKQMLIKIEAANKKLLESVS